MKRQFIIIMVTMMAILSLVLAGCAGLTPVSQSSSTPDSAGKTAANSGSNPTTGGQNLSTGKLNIVVTDAPAKDEIKKIMVTVESISIHKAGADEAKPTVTANATSEGSEDNQKESNDSGKWTTIDVSNSEPFDLFTVKLNPQTLASAFPEVGTYTQIRMEVSKVVITFVENGQEVEKEATVPSGKIKFVHPFEITAGGTTELLFDFDAAKSVNVKGKGDVMFKPVIKLTSSKKQDKEPKTSDNGSPTNLVITTPKLANGNLNTAYEASLAAKGGKTPYTWSLTAGSLLPFGLDLNTTTGVISGTPTISGNNTFTVQVQDSSTPKLSDTKEYKIIVTDLQITTAALPNVTKNTLYNVNLAATGGTVPYKWSVIEGSLPTGLELNANTGIISGTPNTSGSYNFTVKVEESSPDKLCASRHFTIVVTNP